ncbi:amidase signature enzyme [Mycena olivaceomarginata]|nr:amidase signature enzyme [Mycena olivaceomarginata]
MGGSRLDIVFASDKKRPKALSSSEVGPHAPNASFRRRLWFSLALILLCMNLARWLSFFKFSPAPILPDLYEASIRDLQAGLDRGHFFQRSPRSGAYKAATFLIAQPEIILQGYFARIEEVNVKGPGLRAVIELNPSALKVAALLDLERRYTGKRSELHGIPILAESMSDCITAMNTTAGSFALLGSIKLRKAGAIILGKANLSEFSGSRGTRSGWSGRGGQGTGAYYPHANPCGSSSGSAVAVSIGLAPVALGTETDGSITCPSSHNNLAGIKPTLGWTSRAGVIPISANQDTAGPMARSMTDAAINAFMGKRIGVPRRLFLNGSIVPMDPSLVIAFEGALETMKKLGATIVDPADLLSTDELLMSGNETRVLQADFKVYLNQYFESLLENPSGVRSLADLIKFNDKNPELETPEGYEDQSGIIASESTNGFDAEYWVALAANHDIGRTRGIDYALKEYDLDALVLPGPGYTSRPAAVAGYPILTCLSRRVSIGGMEKLVYPAPGIPFGLSFWLIGLDLRTSRRRRPRLARRAFPAAIPKMQLKDVVGK